LAVSNFSKNSESQILKKKRSKRDRNFTADYKI